MQLCAYQLAKCANTAPVVVPFEVVVNTVEERLVAHSRDGIGKCFAVLCVVVYLGEELIAPLVDTDGYVSTLVSLKSAFYHSEPLGC